MSCAVSIKYLNLKHYFPWGYFLIVYSIELCYEEVQRSTVLQYAFAFQNQKIRLVEMVKYKCTCEFIKVLTQLCFLKTLWIDGNERPVKM